MYLRAMASVATHIVGRRRSCGLTMWHHRIAKRSNSNCRIIIPLSENQHEALVDSETLETVRKLIEIIREILSDQKVLPAPPAPPSPVNPS